MAGTDVNYIVNAPTYDENRGGTIFLHELVNALNERGERAALWPIHNVYDVGMRRKIKNFFGIDKPEFRTSPALDTPMATRADLAPSSVVVYPEIVRGNPLGAKHVARWLLYTPGKRHPYEFGPDEMFFRVDEFADLPEVTGGAPDLFLWKVNPVYRNENRPDRSGACFIVRKGGDLPRQPVTEGAIQIDGKSHEEINEIFNRCETFYSYDDATMYSQYAAVCGCLSVVIPSGDASRDETVSNHMLGRYGIAYGFEDEKIRHALATRDKVLDLLLERERAGQRTVDAFVAATKARVAAVSAT
jgi:hypothetical protein